MLRSMRASGLARIVFLFPSSPIQGIAFSGSLECQLQKTPPVVVTVSTRPWLAR
jgi:hypothetical protein